MGVNGCLKVDCYRTDGHWAGAHRRISLCDTPAKLVERAIISVVVVAVVVAHMVNGQSPSFSGEPERDDQSGYDRFRVMLQGSKQISSWA